MTTNDTVYAARAVPAPDPKRQLAEKAGQTTPENPWPLRLLAQKMRAYIERMPQLWVEAQVLEYRPRPGTRMAFFVLRDPQTDVSMNITAYPSVVEDAGPAFEPGARVILRVKPNFWETRGTLSLRAEKIFVEGEGDLLARVEQLRKQLAAEGLFAVERKRRIPFIPQRIGLICGRGAKAKDDVLVNALARWPAAAFEIREVAVQGERCVTEVTAALHELDRDIRIDVIIITRGGGSVEDLLPFSDEALVRAVAAATTPIISAIGHEEDAPLLDLVADVRASTPTDAARQVVPHLAELKVDITHGVTRLRGAITRRLEYERNLVDGLVSRPVLASPTSTIEQQSDWVATQLVRMSAAVSRRVGVEQSRVSSLSATLTALSPEATLRRGYTILRNPAGKIVRSTEDLARGNLLEGVLSEGTFVVQVVGVNPEGSLFEAEGNQE